MPAIRPVDLPPAASVLADAAIIIDTGIAVEKATPLQIVDTGRPQASQAEAEAGAENSKSMTPLRVLQAITSIGSGLFATLSAFAASSGSALVGFLQGGVDAVAQTAQAKLREMPVSLEDFGGGAAIADNRDALVKALKTGRPIKLGDGDYEWGDSGNIDFGALNTGGSPFQVPCVTILGNGIGRSRLIYTGTGTAMIGGATAPASAGYKQHLFLHGVSFLGTGRVPDEVVPSIAITYERFTTSPNVFAGSDSTQLGILWEFEPGSEISNCELAQWGTALQTKIGYGATIRNNHIRYNNVGLDLRAATTTLCVQGNTIERNAIGIALWIATKIGVLNNVIQGNYGGCDAYVFAQANLIDVAGNTFEASPQCFVIDGGTVDPANITARINSMFNFENNVALGIEIKEFMANARFQNNRLTEFVVDAPTPYGTSDDARLITGITIGDNFQNADPSALFTNFTGAGAGNLIRVGRPIIKKTTYNPASMAAGATDSATTTVTGAVVGDQVDISFSTPLAGATLNAWVSAADTVQFLFHNLSGGTLDLASGTLSIRVSKP